MHTVFWTICKSQDWSCHVLHFISSNERAFFSIQITAIISTVAMIVWGEWLHIYYSKKERRKKKKKKEKEKEKKITVGFWNAVLSLCVCVCLIQLFSSNLLPYYFHTSLISESLYLPCLQLKILKIFFLYWNFKNIMKQDVVWYLVAQSCLTLCNPMDYSLPGSSFHGDSSGKDTGEGCHFLLQGIFPTQGSNIGLLHFKWDKTW